MTTTFVDLDVRPILRKNCTVCHTERKLDEPDVSAGLALNTPALIRKGGKVPVLKPDKPDESLLVSTGTDGTVHRVDLATGQVRVLRGHGPRVWHARFTPDGQHFVTATGDGGPYGFDLPEDPSCEVLLWDRDAARPPVVIDRLRLSVLDLDLSARHIAIASQAVKKANGIPRASSSRFGRR